MMSLVAFPPPAGPRRQRHPAVTITVIGDLYKLRGARPGAGPDGQRLATSAVIGPLAADHRRQPLLAWIFWINIPVGLVTIVGSPSPAGDDRAGQARIDYLGAALLLRGGRLAARRPDRDGGGAFRPSPLWGFCASSAAGCSCGRSGGGGADHLDRPLGAPAVATSNAASLLTGMALIGLTTVLPIYVQGVLGRSPIVAGFTLTMLIVGWPLAVMLTGAASIRTFGIRRTLRFGSMLFPIGASFLLS